MMTLVFGAGGHALEMLAVARRCGAVGLDPDTTVLVVDEPSSSVRTGLPFPIILQQELAHADDREVYAGLVAVGSSEARAAIVQHVDDLGLNITYPNLIDPSAVVLQDPVDWEPAGRVIFPHAFVSDRAVLGRHSQVNTLGLVGHEASLGDFVTLAARATVCGRASIAPGCFLGASSTVIDDVAVTAGTVIGAGAVVVDDIDVPGIYIGVPARRMPDATSGLTSGHP